jgi:origin recognition complex subunit 2
METEIQSWSVEDKERFQALEARFFVQDFGKIWKPLQDAGWTYQVSNGSYISPPPFNYACETAQHVCDLLNETVVLEVYSNLQSSSLSGLGRNEEEAGSLTAEELAQLRKQAIYYYFLKRRASKSKLKDNGGEGDPSVEKDSKDKDTCTAVGHEKSFRGESPIPKGRHSLRVSSRATAVDLPHSSATTLEKGSNLYLHKNSKRTRQAQQRSALRTAATQDDAAVPLIRPSLDECAALISSYPISEVEDTENSLQERFPEWRFLLSTNHSLLFYGAGSKRNLMDEFARRELDKEGYVVIIDSTDPDVNIKAVLDLLVTLFCSGTEPRPMSAIPLDNTPEVPVVGRSNPWKAPPLVERAIAIGRALARYATIGDNPTYTPIFLVFYNMDAGGMATRIAQDALASLIVNSTVANGIQSVRVIASVDLVDAPWQMWSSSTAANFSWFHQEVHTHRPYVEELTTLRDQEARQLDKRSNGKKSSFFTNETTSQASSDRILRVLQNLAPRHAEVVQILARLQLDSNQDWIEYRDFCNACKKACVIAKDSQLRAFLSELTDHELIAMNTTANANRKTVRVPHPRAQLQEILAMPRKH